MKSPLKVDLKDPEVRHVVTDVLSQSISGELIGMANFASLADTIDDIEEMMEAVEHAESERLHAVGFLEIAKKHELNPVVNTQGHYWHGMRKKFKKYASRQDFISCLIIQEVMLESYAVSMYKDLGNAIGGEIGELFLLTSDEEQEHLDHSADILSDELEKRGDEFVNEFKDLHFDCMTILAEFASQNKCINTCGVCQDQCMKEDMHAINVGVKELRANALKTYAKALDKIGLPTEETTRWIVQLPL